MGGSFFWMATGPPVNSVYPGLGIGLNGEIQGKTEIKFTYQLWKANAIASDFYMGR